MGKIIGLITQPVKEVKEQTAKTTPKPVKKPTTAK